MLTSLVWVSSAKHTLLLLTCWTQWLAQHFLAMLILEATAPVSALATHILIFGSLASRSDSPRTAALTWFFLSQLLLPSLLIQLDRWAVIFLFPIWTQLSQAITRPFLAVNSSLTTTVFSRTTSTLSQWHKLFRCTQLRTLSLRLFSVQLHAPLAQTFSPNQLPLRRPTAKVSLLDSAALAVPCLSAWSSLLFVLSSKRKRLRKPRNLFTKKLCSAIADAVAQKLL